MAVNDFVRRSIQIVGGGIVGSTTDYFDNAISFVNDTKEVIDMGKQSASDGAKKFTELRSSHILKKVRDWFYNEGGMFGDFDFDDDDFDAGFEIDNDDENPEDSKPLSKDMMTDIAKKQTGAMYKAMGHQADLNIANTAEIISTINTRSAELTASVNNVNNTLIQLGKRLDLIVEWTAGRVKKSEEEKRSASILGYGGEISLSGIAAKTKENLDDNPYLSMLSTFKNMFSSGMMTPEMVLSMVLQQTILDKKWKGLNDKSVNDIGEFINDTIGEAIQNSLAGILTFDKGPFGEIFEDLITKSGAKNYQSYVVNQYNDKPAVFDGMTRKSIVSVIPGYLSEILKAVGGKNLTIDSKGQLINSKSNKFVQTVSDQYFRPGTIGYKERDLIETRSSIENPLSSEDINLAMRTLAGFWSWYFYRHGKMIFKKGEVTDITFESTAEVVNDAAEAMVTIDPKHRSKEQWLQSYQLILMTIDEYKYRMEIQRLADRADKELTTFAKTDIHGYQAGRINKNTLYQALRHSVQQYDRYATFNNEGMRIDDGTASLVSSVTPTTIGSSTSSDTNPLAISQMDMLAGIFDRLNKGLNVYVLGQNKKGRKSPLDQVKMTPGYFKTLFGKGILVGTDEGSDTVATVTATVDKAEDIVDTVATTLSGGKDKLREEAEKAGRSDIVDIMDKPEEERTKSEKRKLSRYQRKVGVDKTVELVKTGKEVVSDFINKDPEDGTSEGYTISKGIADFAKKITPEPIKDFFGAFKKTESYENISNSEIGKKVKDTEEKAKDKLFGKEVETEEGTVRTGGSSDTLLGWVRKGLKGAGSFLKEGRVGGSIFIPSIGKSSNRLKKDADKIFKNYEDKFNALKNEVEERGEVFDADKYSDQFEDMKTLSEISSFQDAITKDDIGDGNELSSFEAIANRLHDSSLKRQVKQTMIPLLKKNLGNGKVKDEGDKPKTLTGMLGKLLLGGIKSFLTPLIAYIKLTALGLFKYAKWMGGKIFNFVTWGIKRNVKRMYYGAKSVIVSTKDLIKLTTEKLIKPIVSKIYDIAKKLNDGIRNIGGKILSGIGDVGKKLLDGTGKIGKIFSGALNAAKKAGGGLMNMKNAFYMGLSERSDFANGFFRGWRERNEKKLGEQAAPTVEAIKKSKIGDKLDILKENGEKFFKDIKSCFETITSDNNKNNAEMVKVVKEAAKEIGGKLDSNSSNDSSKGEEVVGTVADKATENLGNALNNSGGGSDSDRSDPDGSDSGNNPRGGNNNNNPDRSDSGDNSRGGNNNNNNGRNNNGRNNNGGSTDKSVMGILGGIIGGSGDWIMAIINLVAHVLLSLETITAFIDTLFEATKEMISPLNDVMKSFMKIWKPYAKQMTSVYKTMFQIISKILTTIVETLVPVIVDIISPIIEAIHPIFETLLAILTPWAKMWSSVMNVCLIPIMSSIKYVLIPIVKIIADLLMAVIGVIGMVMGAIYFAAGNILEKIGGLGGIITGGFGKMAAAITGDKDLDISGKVLESGEEMVNAGVDLIKMSWNAFKEGMGNLGFDVLSMLTLGISDSLLGRNQTIETDDTPKQIEATDDNVVQKTYASGDVNSNNVNTNTNTTIYNTYGGEYQRGMGGYLNMNQRGCGPIALADMYNRSGGSKISGRDLAGSMYANGTYDPRRGTSIGGYIDTAHSLGMNLTPGKVTRESLKLASPSNPITVVGSGSDYGTRNGNNHFMNVIGTDHHGGAYVSNPLTGRIDRKPASSIAGTSVLGLYGAGDDDGGGYSFPQAVSEAFKELKDQASKILGIFSMEKSEKEQIEDKMNEEKNAAAADQGLRQLRKTDPDKAEELEAKARELARADFEAKYPKKDSETDEEYESDFEKWYASNSAKYLAKAYVGDEAVQELAKDGINDTEKNYMAKILDMDVPTKLEDARKSSMEYVEFVKSYLKDIKNNARNAAGSGGYFTTESGKSKLALYNPTITDVDMMESDGGHYKHAPLLEFFTKSAGTDAFLYGQNFYKQYGTDTDHTAEGVGLSGDNHQGIDIHWEGEEDGKIPIYAPTDGILKLRQPEALAAGGGNYVEMTDNDGNRHRFMHMNRFSDEIKNMSSGSEIIGGKTILGYEGYTGSVSPPGPSGMHTHYDIYLKGVTHTNPLTYFSKYVPGNKLAGSNNAEKIWGYMINHGFEPHAAAGAMGAWQVESANDPDTLEGYYAFGDGSRNNSVVKEAMKSFDSMDDYVVNKLFPMYDRSGKSINKPGYKGTDGHYYPGLGLAQWTGDRTVALSKYTVGKGLGWNDLGGQLDYMDYEVTNNSRYKSALDQMNSSKNVDEATRIWLNMYEGNEGDKLDERQRYAREFYEQLKDWVPSANDIAEYDDNSSSGSTGSSSSLSGSNLIEAIVNADGGLNVRADKSTSSEIVGLLKDGTVINIESPGNGNWAYVPDLNGYVYSGFLTYDGTSSSSSSSPSSTNNSVITMGDTDIKPSGDYVLPENSNGWDAGWYNKIENRHFFLDDGNSSPRRPDGIFKKLENMVRGITIDNDRGKRLKKLFNDDGDFNAAYNKLYNNAYTDEDWLKIFQNYQKNKKDGMFPEALKHVKYAWYGSGDASSDEILSEDKFWNDYLGWNSMYGNSNLIQPVDTTSPSTNQSGTYYDTETGRTVVNNYTISRTEDKVADARIKAVLENTYNVRSENMEALLSAILEELRKRKSPPTDVRKNTNGSTDLFNEGIPSQVSRLAIG